MVIRKGSEIIYLWRLSSPSHVFSKIRTADFAFHFVPVVYVTFNMEKIGRKCPHYGMTLDVINVLTAYLENFFERKEKYELENNLFYLSIGLYITGKLRKQI